MVLVVLVVSAAAVVFFMLFNPLSVGFHVVLSGSLWFSVLNVLEALFCSLLHARVDVLEQEIVAFSLPTYSLYVGVLASR